jgi:hypothetical protein
MSPSARVVIAFYSGEKVICGTVLSRGHFAIPETEKPRSQVLAGFLFTSWGRRDSNAGPLAPEATFERGIGLLSSVDQSVLNDSIGSR